MAIDKAKLRFGYTYFSTYKGIVGLYVYKPGLFSLVDPLYTTVQAGKSGQYLAEFQPYKTSGNAQYHWLDISQIREATVSDFQVGDIITENSLMLFNAEIIDIKYFTSKLTDPPIVAEQIDDDGSKTGNIFHLEPEECIMVSKLNEDTLDLGLSKAAGPKDNQGRTHCWWCKTKTHRVMGFSDQYDVCPKCKK